MIGKFPFFKTSFHIQINNVIFNSIKLTNTPDGVVKLEIAQAQPSDCGAYKLVISNPNGESAALCAVAIKRTFSKLAILLHSNNVVLIFFAAEPMKPVFIKPLNDLKVVIGQPINLEAQISGTFFNSVKKS